MREKIGKSWFVGFSDMIKGTKVVDLSRLTINFSTKQLLACGVEALFVLIAGAAFVINYLANNPPKPMP